MLSEARFFAINNPADDDVPRFDCYLDDLEDIFEAFNKSESERSAAAIPRTSPFMWDAVRSTPE
jgi:hypothetical protein